jgi:hypothetical protein
MYPEVFVSYRAVYSLVLLRDKCTLILVFQLFHNLQDKFLWDRAVVEPGRSRAAPDTFLSVWAPLWYF